ncbi:glycoside hydrolase family 3 C-terminal domain-containing protein [Eisenbergiella sp.]
MSNLYMPKRPLSRDRNPGTRSQEELSALARQLAAESIVLLANEDRLLPLAEGTRAAFFGRAQLDTLIGGSGSGASRNAGRTALILEECNKAGILPVPRLASYYREQLSRETVEDPFARLLAEGADLINSGIIYEIFGKYEPPKEEFPVPEELLEEAAAQTDTAVLVLGRSSGGEECDRHVPEDYYLTQKEETLVGQVCGSFSRVVLILNINGVIDTSWIADFPSIRAVLFLGLPGEQGAAALADILTGKTTPSGKLCSTFACSYGDYPSAAHFSWDKAHPETILEYRDYGLNAEENGSLGFTKSPVTVYLEDIYMGYRYFDSFGKKVVYPFGFGLSYADFEIGDCTVQKAGENLIVKARVTNRSSRYAGKEVVQIYLSAPQGKLEKPYQELKAWEKTALLAPGECGEISASIPLEQLASYDEDSSSYILEPGIYYVRVGSSSRNTHIAGAFLVSGEIVCAQYENRLGLRPCNRDKLHFLSASQAATYTYPGEAEEKQIVPAFTLTQMDITLRGPSGLTPVRETKPVQSRLSDVSEGRVDADSFLSQLSVEELAVLANGYGPGLPFGGFGSKAAPTISYENGEPIAVCTHPDGHMGYVSPALPKYGIPSIFYKDGPASVGKTAWPTGMLLACSFSPEMLYAFGSACGYEACIQNVDSWLAPALNLHRNPIGGRNFEYFSEDPVLAGVCGVNVCRGAEENNPVTACPKHFAINEQETYRRGSSRFSYDAVDSILTERAARELYLKPFEMAVRGSSVHTFMTSFNKINGTFAGGSRDLCTGILREEWGYDGIVVTDWGDMDIAVDGADAVAAGNDIIMPGGPPVIAQVLKGYEEGRVTRQQLMQAAAHLIKTLCRTKSCADYIQKKEKEQK